MSKVIVIDSCLTCPHRDHKGAFARVAYIPVCGLKSRRLPYKQAEAYGMIVANPTGKIPTWCPLENRNED